MFCGKMCIFNFYSSPRNKILIALMIICCNLSCTLATTDPEGESEGVKEQFFRARRNDDGDFSNATVRFPIVKMHGHVPTVLRTFPLIVSGMLNTTLKPRFPIHGSHYIIIIDAATAGTTATAYKFRLLDKFAIDTINLVAERHAFATPGLLLFVDYPERGSALIMKLIDMIGNFIPKKQIEFTRVVMRITTGFKSIPFEVAKKLLNTIQHKMYQLPYLVDYKSARILDEDDEGVYLWYTVNLLMNGYLTKKRTTETYATVDMGAGLGSLVSEVDKDCIDYPKKDIQVRPLSFNRTLFAHSFYGQGVERARYGTLLVEQADSPIKDVILSSCIDPTVVNREVNFFEKVVSVSGRLRDGLTAKQSYDRCHKYVLKFVNSTMGYIVNFGIERPTFLTNYYFNLALQENILESNNLTDKYGRVTPRMYYDAAAGPGGACGKSDPSNPWRCFDLVLATTILVDAFNVDMDQVMDVGHQLHGYHINWSLGLAYNYICAQIVDLVGKRSYDLEQLRELLYK